MSDDDDTPNGGLQVFADIKAHLGNIAHSTKKMETAWIQRASNTPRDVLLRFTGVCPGAGGFTLLGGETGGSGPMAGEVWILRACRIGGIAPTTTAAGRGDLYQSPVDPTAAGATPSTASWIDQAVTLPLVGTYSSRQVVLRSPDNFYIVITNGTTNQQYVANAQFEVYTDGTLRAQEGL